MPRKQFEILYPDGSRKHISAIERDALMLAREIKFLAPQKYKFIGQVKTFHSFAALGELKLKLEHSPEFRRYLSGSYIWVDPQGMRHNERMETVEAMELRLEQRQAAA